MLDEDVGLAGEGVGGGGLGVAAIEDDLRGFGGVDGGAAEGGDGDEKGGDGAGVGRGVLEKVFAVGVSGGFGEDGAVRGGEEDAGEGGVVELAAEVVGEQGHAQEGQEAEAHQS